MTPYSSKLINAIRFMNEILLNISATKSPFSDCCITNCLQNSCQSYILIQFFLWSKSHIKRNFENPHSSECHCLKNKFTTIMIAIIGIPNSFPRLFERYHVNTIIILPTVYSVSHTWVRNTMSFWEWMFSVIQLVKQCLLHHQLPLLQQTAHNKETNHRDKCVIMSRVLTQYLLW